MLIRIGKRDNGNFEFGFPPEKDPNDIKEGWLEYNGFIITYCFGSGITETELLRLFGKEEEKILKMEPNDIIYADLTLTLQTPQ